MRKAEFFHKKRGNLPKFGIFPRFSEFFREKKRPRHAKSVPGSVRRASHHAKSVTCKERLFGINFVVRKILGRSNGRSLQKIRYLTWGETRLFPLIERLFPTDMFLDPNSFWLHFFYWFSHNFWEHWKIYIFDVCTHCFLFYVFNKHYLECIAKKK